jgi:hypothetical protein
MALKAKTFRVTADFVITYDDRVVDFNIHHAKAWIEGAIYDGLINDDDVTLLSVSEATEIPDEGK